MRKMKKIIKKWNEISLVKRIICGLVIGIILGLTVPQASVIGLLGDLFVGALRAVAPLLVLFLVMGALSHQREGKKSNMKRVIFLYLLGTFLAGCVAVAASFLFPVTITLTETSAEAAAPSGIGEVLNSLLMSIVSNPVDALANANYLGILAWAVLLGITLRKASEGTKKFDHADCRRFFNDRAVDHQLCSVRRARPCIQHDLRTGAFLPSRIRKADPASCRKHGIRCLYSQSSDHVYRHTEESLSARPQMSERQWHYRILHKKLCR